MTPSEDTADHVLANRASWDADAESWVERGRRPIEEAWKARKTR